MQGASSAKNRGPTRSACRTPYKELSEEFGLQPVKRLWTVEKRLGGWKEVQSEFFDDKVGAEPG